MLDGLLGSNFKAKCKSEIKSIKARIEQVRRRAEAKQRFLKEDLAKLLVNGLDVDAFSRTEEYLALQNILASYDFIEQTCEYITGQLSCMQKLRECPEECREAVGSLMFAAARFSDLPELRDLRDLLQGRYGNSLECFVNQKFLEKLSSRPPEKERKIMLLKDIESEYSLKWDAKGFEQRMDPPAVIAQIQSQARKHGSNYVAPKDYNQLIKKDGCARPNNNEYLTTEKRSELPIGGDKMRRSAEDSIPEPNKQGVVRQTHMHVYGGERKHSDTEGFKREYSTPETDRRDVTKQRPDLVLGGDKMPRSIEGTFYTREDSNPEQNTQDVLRHRHRHRRVHYSESKNSDRERLQKDYSTLETDKRDVAKQRPELVKDKYQAQTGTNVEYLRRKKQVLPIPNDVMEGRAETLNNEKVLRNGKEAEASGRSNHAKEATRSRRSPDTERSENVDTGFMIQNYGVNNIRHRISEITPFHGQSPVERRDVPSASNYRSEMDVEKFRTNVLEEKSVPAPPYSRSHNSMLPPPYTKPRDSKHRSSRGSRHENSEQDGPSVETSHNRDHAVDFSERIQKEADQNKQEKERAERIPPKTYYPEDLDHDHNGMLPLPKPRSIRRKHRRSLTHQEVGSSEDAGAIRRSSSSRRREHSRKGLQLLVDDKKPKDDKEEKIIDKMLLHYCKKPSNYDIEKLRPKSNAHSDEKRTVHAGESSHDQRRGVHDEESEHVPVTTRSFSLPHKHTSPPEDIKAFTRVNSFQPDDQERHVHPKLPDYDDFVASLAALRGR